MKLLSKLALFITLSKILIVVVFVLSLPSIVHFASFRYSNYYLKEQRGKVLSVINKNGINYYLDGDSAYASYTMLKEEYISILPSPNSVVNDTIETARRIIEGDTLNYRILVHQLRSGNHLYILEIGKTTRTIDQYNGILQRFALYILAVLIVLSIVLDLIYTQILLRPLGKIVRTKLFERKFPFREPLVPVKTSTLDFKYLDESLINLMGKIHEAFEKEREFTSNASHELMTPISILQTHVENLMMEEGIGEELQERISVMMKTLNRLKKIVHSLLYISRIENDQFSKLDILNMKGMVSEVVEELSPRLESKGIRLNNNLSSRVKVKEMNHDLVFQMIYNLINNAIRYNKENGEITLRDAYVNDGEYLLFIEDTGIGIKSEDLGLIFDRFKKSGYRDGEGNGIGLSIVRSIATFLNLTIKVSSQLGNGTCFTIHFPPYMWAVS